MVKAKGDLYMPRHTQAFNHLFCAKILATIFLALFADFLFFNEKIGWTAGWFALFTLSVFLIFNINAVKSRDGKILTALAAFESLLLIEHPNALSLALYILSMMGLAVLSRHPESEVFSNVLSFTKRLINFILPAPFRLPVDIMKCITAKETPQNKGWLERFIRRWALPASLTIAFIFLFANANPLIDRWLNSLDIEIIAEILNIGRIIFWIVAAAALWPFIRPRVKALLQKEPRAVDENSAIAWLFTPESILRSLIIFNILFFLQTVMDVMFLWGGTALPDGMSHAGYAHRGAYPLVATALLAAAFVLIAFRSNNRESAGKWTLNLVYLWIAQNIFLVISSIWRTHLYVEEYSLTYLRFAALVWMGLVAFGLVMIIARLAWQKSNLWLLNVNTVAALIVLVICSGLNIGGMIANYNVRHNYQITGKGQYLDLFYLGSLGPDALPALEWLSHQKTRVPNVVGISHHQQNLHADLQNQLSYWRGWSFRSYRLSKQKPEWMGRKSR